MNVESVDYKENTIRYTVVADNGILLNTKDICRTLGITKEERIAAEGSGAIFSHPCMDVAGVIEASFTGDRNDEEFVDWLEEKFRGYELRTPIRPNCDEEWKLK